MFSTLIRGAGKKPALRTFVVLALIGALSATPLAISGCSDDSSGPTPDPTGSYRGSVTEPQSGLPVVGASVTIDPVAGKKAATTTTNADGEFWFVDLEPGNYLLTVDASGVVVDAGNPDLVYAGSTIEISIVAGQESSNDFFTPIVDSSEDTGVIPGEPTVLEPESIPGLRIDIPADAVTFPAGSSETLNVVELGFDQGPTPLAAGVAPTMMIRILPEGTTFDPPATITWPNRDEMESDHPFEQFSHDGDGWASDGDAAANGATIDADLTTTVSVASSHYIACDQHTVIGQVLDQVESPIEGANVSLWARIQPFGEPQDVELEGLGDSTDASGNFSFAGVRACRVHFTAEYATAEGYGSIDETEIYSADPSGTTDFGAWLMEITTQTRFVVEGTVRQTNGSPAVGVYVSWYDPNAPRKVGGPITNEFGEYSLEVEYDPGKVIRVQAWDESSGASGDVEITVPPLDQQGTTVAADDLYICLAVENQNPCGEWGTWELSGSTLTLAISELECGQVQTDIMDIEIISLVDGALTIEFEESVGSVQATLTRVQGNGPSGISAGNLPGIYGAPDASLIVGFYADGTMNAWSGDNDIPLQVQWGVYSLDGNEATVDFLFSNEEGGGPQVGDSMVLTLTREGDTLEMVTPDETLYFEGCDHGPDDGEFENSWAGSGGGGGDLTIVFYDGEFAAISLPSIDQQKWFR